MKIGIFGGSFDPIHSGHAIIANYASQWMGLDEVWLMVSPQNPFKQNSDLSPEESRCEMAELVAGDCRNVKVSRFELTLPRPSYSYRTLSLLKKEHPEDEFTLIIGSDNWQEFGRWRDNEKIIEEFDILIYPRPGYEIDASALPPGVRIMDEAPQVFISSTFVRQSVKEGKNVNFFIPPRVYEYIRKHNLYR